MRTSGLSSPMKDAAKIFLENNQGSSMLSEQMNISPELPSENKIIGLVIVHTISVLFASTKQVLLTPFCNMLTSPDALIVWQLLIHVLLCCYRFCVFRYLGFLFAYNGWRQCSRGVQCFNYQWRYRRKDVW